jgi:hypothetical protein
VTDTKRALLFPLDFEKDAEKCNGIHLAQLVLQESYKSSINLKRQFLLNVNLSFLSSPIFCTPSSLLNIYNGTNPCHVKETVQDVCVLVHILTDSAGKVIVEYLCPYSKKKIQL